MAKKNWLGWHFATHGGRLRYQDTRRPKKGDTLTRPLQGGLSTVREIPVVCRFGFHASADIIDALLWAPHTAVFVARVRLGGEIVHEPSKSAGMERTMITGYANIRKELALFIQWCRGRHGHGRRRPQTARGACLAASDTRTRVRYEGGVFYPGTVAGERERAAQSKYLEKLVRAAIKRAEKETT